MKDFVLKGQIIDSLDQNRFRILENGYLVVEGGLCQGAFEALPERWQGLPVTDFGDRLIFPGMCDLHVHASQYGFRGLGMDMELLDWLNTYTFPEEAKYRDPEYADRAYEAFVAELRRDTTTRASIFATIHRESTLQLMQKLEDSGLKTLVGKVNMDRNSPDLLREPDVPTALEETELWIQESIDRFSNTRPILTPRFIPSCSDQLMSGLKVLQKKYGLPTQSHLSENYGEIAWVKELSPASRFYGDAYERFGMFGGDHKCVMAHCVHSGEEEMELIHRNGVYIAHSPESNMNLASGVAPVSRFLELGLNVGLATDMAGGSSLCMLRAIAHAIQASKLRWRLKDDTVKPLTVEQAFWLATAGGGSFFGKVGRFLEGYEFDAVVLDDSGLAHPQPLDVRSRLERALYLADDRNVYAKFVAGRRLF